MPSTVIYATTNGMNYDATNGWATTSGGAGSITLTGSDVGYTLDANGKTGIVLNIDASVDSLQASDGTGYFSWSANRTLNLGWNSVTAGVNYSGTSTSGMLRGSAGVLTINGTGAGTTAVLNSGAGYAIVTSSTGGLAVNNTGGTGLSCTTTSGRAASLTSSGILTISVGSGSLAINNSGSGFAVLYGSSSTSSVITGDIQNSNAAGRGLFVNGGKVAHTGQAIQTIPLQLSTSCGPVVVSGGTYKWTGMVTVANGVDNYIFVNTSGSTVDLTGLVCTCAGRLVINNLAGGTVTQSTGAITLNTSAGQACCLGSAITITPASSGTGGYRLVNGRA